MPKSLVRWEVDVEHEDAETPKEQAEHALMLMQRHDTTATVFQVFPDDGEPTEVDLTCNTVMPYESHNRLRIAVLDDEGTPVSEKALNVSTEAIEDMVSHALQLAVLESTLGFDHVTTQTCWCELNCALDRIKGSL